MTVFSNGAAAGAALGVRLDDLGGLINDLEMCAPAGDRIGMTDLRVLRRRTGFAGTRARCFVGAAGLCGLMPAGDGRVMWWVRHARAGHRPARAFRAYGGPVAHLLGTITSTQTFAHVVHQPPNALARLAGRFLPPAVAGRAYLALIRRFSSVLTACPRVTPLWASPSG